MKRREIKAEIASNAGSEVSLPAGQNDPISFLKARYYTEDGNPLPFDEIANRIKRNEKMIKRSSYEIALDLYFFHKYWDTFYKRGESFRKWVDENLNISWSYTFDIIKSVELLVWYQGWKDTDIPPESIPESFEEFGVGKLKVIAQVEDVDKKSELMENLFAGENISVSQILSINKSQKQPTIGQHVNVAVLDENQNGPNGREYKAIIVDELSTKNTEETPEEETDNNGGLNPASQAETEETIQEDPITINEDTSISVIYQDKLTGKNLYVNVGQDSEGYDRHWFVLRFRQCDPVDEKFMLYMAACAEKFFKENPFKG